MLQLFINTEKYIRKYTGIFLVYFLFNASAEAQEIDWIKNYGTGYEYRSNSFKINNTDYITRYDEWSIYRWNKDTIYADTLFDNFHNIHSIAVTADKRIVLGGSKYKDHFYLALVDSDYKQIWKLEERQNNPSKILKVAVNDNEIVAIGMMDKKLTIHDDTVYNSTADLNMFIIVLDFNGRVKRFEMVRYHDKWSNITPYELKMDKDGEILISGTMAGKLYYRDSMIFDTSYMAYDGFGIKLDNTGRLKWSKHIINGAMSGILLGENGTTYATSGIPKGYVVINGDTVLKNGKYPYGTFTYIINDTGAIKIINTIGSEGGGTSRLGWKNFINNKLILIGDAIKKKGSPIPIDSFYINDKLYTGNKGAGRIIICEMDLDGNILKTDFIEGRSTFYALDGIFEKEAVTVIGISNVQADTIFFDDTPHDVDFRIGAIKINYTHSPVTKIVKEQPALYPNPTAGLIHFVLNYNEKDYYLKVYDIQGKLLQQECFKASFHIPLDISMYSNGVYIIELYNAEERFNYKVVLDKQRL